MTKRRKDTDYLFLSARIRAMERRLLTAQRLEQLLTAPSVEACAQLLSEWGYAPVHDEPSLQAALSAQREAVFADVSRFMPEAEVLDVFRLKYDYHNIKTLLKAPQNNCFFWAACRRPFFMWWGTAAERICLYRCARIGSWES